MTGVSGGQIAWIVGLVTFVATALLGQAELLGEPWRHYVAILAIVGTAVSGYMVQRPLPPPDPPPPNFNGR